MNRNEKMLSLHSISLSAHYGEKLKKMNFLTPYSEEKDNDSLISNSPSTKTAFITRHLLTGEVTHSLILDKEWYSRL